MLKKSLPDRRCAKNNEYYIQIVRVPLRHAHTQRHRESTHGACVGGCVVFVGVATSSYLCCKSQATCIMPLLAMFMPLYAKIIAQLVWSCRLPDAWCRLPGVGCGVRGAGWGLHCWVPALVFFSIPMRPFVPSRVPHAAGYRVAWLQLGALGSWLVVGWCGTL